MEFAVDCLAPDALAALLDGELARLAGWDGLLWLLRLVELEVAAAASSSGTPTTASAASRKNECASIVANTGQRTGRTLSKKA